MSMYYELDILTQMTRDLIMFSNILLYDRKKYKKL